MALPFDRLKFLVTRRAATLGLAVTFGAWAASPALACAPARVLFVCRFGTVKSPVAREHFKRSAAARNLQVTAYARGITPEDHLSPQLAAALAADGIDPKTEPVKTLSAADASAADITVFFDKPPAELAFAAPRDWSDLPSMNEDYAKARAVLLARIDGLLDEIAARRC